MTVQDVIQTLCAYGTPMDEEEFQEALNGAVEKLGAMVELNKQLEELINKPCLNQNMMVQNLAYRNVQKMIKKQLGEYTHENT